MTGFDYCTQLQDACLHWPIVFTSVGNFTEPFAEARWARNQSAAFGRVAAGPVTRFTLEDVRGVVGDWARQAAINE